MGVAMSTQWLRLWHDMPTDPKWRTIARASKQRIGDVMAVYLHVLVCASNATERGRTQSFNCEDVASALDLETEQVAAIVDAMQGRVLDGDTVRGWEKRQVAREDGSAERAKRWREGKKQATERTPNANERTRTHSERKQTPDTDTDTDTDTEEEQEREPRALASVAVPDPPPPREPSPEGDTCRRLIKLGIPQVNPSHPALLDLLRDGATPEGIEQTAAELAQRGRAPGFKLVLATVRGRMEDVAAGITTGRGIRAPPTRATISTPLPEPGSYGQSDFPDDWTPAQAAS